jgi:hypothetical protein
MLPGQQLAVVSLTRKTLAPEMTMAIGRAIISGGRVRN